MSEPQASEPVDGRLGDATRGVGTGAAGLVLATLAPTVMLAVDPLGLFPFGPLKWLAVTVLVTAGAAAVLWSTPVRFVRAPTVASVLLVAWMAVAAIGGEDPLYAWTGTPERHVGVLAWALCALALGAGQCLDAARVGPALQAGLVAAGLGVGGTASAEALGWEPSLFDVDRNLTATFGTSAYLGAAVALLLPIAVGIAADRALPARLRVGAGVGIAPLVVAGAGSGARASWMGVVGAAVVVAWCRRDWLVRHRPTVTIAAGGGAIALVALIVASPVGGRLGSTFDPDEPGGQGRLDEWRVATRVIAEHPVLGVGPEGYRIAFATGADEDYERDHGRDPLPDRAHSAPLDVAVTGGFPALAIWLVVMVTIGRHVMRALTRGRGWLVGVAAGLVAHFGCQLLLFPTAELEPLAWLLAGVVVAATARPSEVRERVVPRLGPAVLAVVAAVALAAGVLDVAADRRASAAADALARGDGPGALEAAQDAVALRPDEVRLRLLQARALVAADGGTLAAVGVLDEALEISPGDPIILLERARLLVARARATRVPAHVSEARTELARLLAGDRVNAALWSEAGAAAALAGDIDDAEEAWLRAEDLAPTDPAPATDLALLYLQIDRPGPARAAVERALEADPDDRRARQVAERVAAADESDG